MAATRWCPIVEKPEIESINFELADTFVQHVATEVKILALLTAEQRKQADEMGSRFGAITGYGHDKIPSP